jgi:hypothetical protein
MSTMTSPTTSCGALSCECSREMFTLFEFPRTATETLGSGGRPSNYDLKWSTTLRSNRPPSSTATFSRFVEVFHVLIWFKNNLYMRSFEPRQSKHFFNRSWFKKEIIINFENLVTSGSKSGLDLKE